MDGISPNLQLYGTSEQVTLPVRLEADRLVVEIVDGALTSIRWDGIEIICGIDCPVRDPDWGTCRVHVRLESFEQVETGGRYTSTFAVGTFRGNIVCEIDRVGELRLRLTLVAETATCVSRAGFVVLQPLDVAGVPLHVLHPDGSAEESVFPRLISPSQPAMNIIGLKWTSHGVAASIRFEGDVFEMEDQRNWSDASYKTFCRPLLLPHPFEVAAGEKIEQAITIRLGGTGKTQATAAAEALRYGKRDGRKVPEFGLALDPAWPMSGALGPVGTAFDCIPPWLVRIDLANDSDLCWLAANAELLRISPFDLETIVDGEPSILMRQLAAASTILHDSALTPRHLFVQPRAYMSCIQTWEAAPAGATPADAIDAARRLFPGVRIGSGMLTNFTELNRCPPAGDFSYVTHSLTPLVHAADDRSVMRTLDTFQAIFDTLERHAKGRPYRLGLASIGMRTNPYGKSVAENIDGVRLAMAERDPRQKGLFGAAWMVGVAAATKERPLEFVALAAPYGPFGVAAPTRSPEAGIVYPAYHTFAAMTKLTGLPRLDLDLPAGLRGIAAIGNNGPLAVIANCTASPIRVDVEPEASARILDAASATAAAADNRWLERVPPSNSPIVIGAFGVAEVHWSGRAAA